MGQALPLPGDHGNDREKIVLEEDPRGLTILVEVGDVAPRRRVGVEDAQGAFHEVPTDVDAAQAGGGQGREGGLAQIQVVGPRTGRTAIHHLDDDTGPPRGVIGLDTGPAGARAGPDVVRASRRDRAIVLAKSLTGITAGEGATKGVVGSLTAETGGRVTGTIFQGAETQLGLGRAPDPQKGSDEKKDPPVTPEVLAQEWFSKNRFQSGRRKGFRQGKGT